MDGPIPATGSSWIISDTANKSVTFAVGMIAAATGDDISLVALRCCEAFGALLPLCVETRRKVEELARRNYTSHVLNYVKAQIGYRKGDSVEQLSRSDSGIRFLCLASTLCTIDQYNAASRLDLLLEKTQTADQQRPTVKQLQAMMISVKTKMGLSDFSKTLAGLDNFTRSALAEYGTSFTIDVAEVPSKASFHELIIALNQVGRIGEAISIEIKLKPQYLPWTWAFMQWCFGLPPKVQTSSGEPILDQEQSCVTLTVISRDSSLGSRKRPRETTDQQLDVILRQDIPNFRQIIFREEIGHQKLAWQGLVPVNTWLEYHFGILFNKFPEIQSDQRLNQAIGQALYFITKCLPERLLLCNDSRGMNYSRAANDGDWHHFFHETTPSPFLDATVRLNIVTDLTKDFVQLIHKDNDTEKTLLPSQLGKLISGGCKRCNSTKSHATPFQEGTLPCRVYELLEAVAELGSALLVFTLFGPMKETYPMVLAGLKFQTSRFHHRLPFKEKMIQSNVSWPRLIYTGWQALMHNECDVLVCPPVAIFKYAAELMGHKKVGDSTIISSLSGQVLFPAFFESSEILNRGYMQLCAFPGKLMKDNMQFDYLIDACHSDYLDSVVTDDETDEDYHRSPEDTDDANDEDGDHDETSLSESVGERANQGESPRDEMDEDIDEDTAADANSSHQLVSAQNQFESTSSNRHPEDIELQELPRASGSGERTAEVTNSPQMVQRSFFSSKRSDTTGKTGIHWGVQVNDNVLKGQLYITDNDQPQIAWFLLESLMKSRLTPPCRHKMSNNAGKLGDSFVFSAGKPFVRNNTETKMLFNVGRGYMEQLECLESQEYYPPTIVHIEGCIRCALQMCISDGCKVVIS